MKTNQNKSRFQENSNPTVAVIKLKSLLLLNSFQNKQKSYLSALTRCNKVNFSGVVQYSNLLVAKATVQCSQVQSSVSQTPTITFIPIAFAFCSSED